MLKFGYMRRRGEIGFGEHDPGRERPSGIDIAAHLENSFAGHKAFLKRDGVQVAGRIEIPNIEQQSPDQIQQINDRARILNFMTGHQGSMVRAAIEQRGGLRDQLTSLQQWSMEVVKTGEASFDDLTDLPIAQRLLEASDAQDLFERIEFSRRNPDAETDDYEEAVRLSAHRVLRLGEHEGWGAVSAALFKDINGDNLGSMLDSLGFIPSAIFEDESIQQLSVGEFGRAERLLRRFEAVPALRTTARNERTKVVQALFTSGKARSLKRSGTQQVTLDSSGVKIFFGSAKKSKDRAGSPIVTHIPFGLMSDTFVRELEEFWFERESDLLEPKLRRAEENFVVGEANVKREHQLAAFVDAMGLAKETPEKTKDVLVREMLLFPDRFAKRVLDRGEIVPTGLIEMLVREYGEAGAFASMRFAETITAEVAGEALQDRRHFLEHGIRDAANQSYKARARVLSDERYYNALKIVRVVLGAGVQTDPAKQFLLFRGQYKKSRDGKQHSFIETVHKGKVARVLVDERKHMKPDQRERVPVFAREAYQEVEESLRTFDHFISRLERMQKLLKYKNKRWEKKFLDDAEEVAVFTLTNATDYYRPVDLLLSQLRDSLSDENGASFLQVMGEVRDAYARSLYEKAEAFEGFRDMLRPEVRVHEVEYGDNFLGIAKTMCPEWGFNEELCLESRGARIVALDHEISSTSETIPVDLEEAVLEKLRVNRNKPLINVVGGARFVDAGENPEDHPLNKMSMDVLSVAHQHSANVAVPGTQSGIGVYFGKQHVRYQNETDHLPFQQRAHFFSISPGGNTVYPENPWMHDTEPSERYAVAPVDTVVTPITALWHLKGEERVEGYDLHIAYMESLFSRISKDQPRVLVAGNGGVFSVMEINESIKNGFDILLISDSGRFAEAAAVVMRELDSLPAVDDPNFDEKVRLLLMATLDEDVLEEHFRKDYGDKTPPDGDLKENYEVHRKYFREFVRLAREYRDRIFTTDLDGLEASLQTFMPNDG